MVSVLEVFGGGEKYRWLKVVFMKRKAEVGRQRWEGMEKKGWLKALFIQKMDLIILVFLEKFVSKFQSLAPVG